MNITQVPGRGQTDRPKCTSHGFRAKFRIRDAVRLRSVKVFVDGKLIKRTSSKRFSLWISSQGLRSGRNTIRVVAVDVNGRRGVASKSFRHCAPATPEPPFTGRVLATP